MQDELSRQIFYWFTDPSEPPSHPIYAVLFTIFLGLSVLGIYLFRALPDWVMEGPQSRRARSLMLAIGSVALLGDSLIIAQMMQVPFLSRRVWLGLTSWTMAALIVCLLLVCQKLSAPAGAKDSAIR